MQKKMALGKGIASLITANGNNSTVPPVLASTPAANGLELQGEMGAELAVTPKEVSKEKPKDKDEGIYNTPLFVDIDQIKPNQYQPRKLFSKQELEELAQSIKLNGLIQPLIVSKADKGFELIAGERRLRAAKMAGIVKVPVVLKRVTDREKLVLAIIENVQRADLNCVEEAMAYNQLMDEFKLTQDEVAHRVGKERSTVANLLRILKLPRLVIEMLQKNELSLGHAKLLVSIKDSKQIERVARNIVEQGISVRELERILTEEKRAVTSGSHDHSKNNVFFDEKISLLRENLERKTGYHFQIKSKKSGSGEFVIKFNNEAEFNDIYEFILGKRQ